MCYGEVFVYCMTIIIAVPILLMYLIYLFLIIASKNRGYELIHPAVGGQSDCLHWVLEKQHSYITLYLLNLVKICIEQVINNCMPGMFRHIHL